MSATNPPCDAARMRARIRDHFLGRITPLEERALRVHLPTCAACRHAYDERSFLAELDPRAPSSRARLARGLGLPPDRPAEASQRWQPIRWGALAAAGVLAAGVIYGATQPKAPLAGLATEPEFAARGSAAHGDELLVYRIRQGEPPARADGELASSDALAFAYENRRGFARLSVFGVDPSGHVFWYVPVWTDAAETSLAALIEKTPGVHEVSEAVRHDLRDEQLQIYALFTDEPVSTRQVEAWLAQGLEPPRFPVRGHVESMSFRVRRP